MKTINSSSNLNKDNVLDQAILDASRRDIDLDAISSPPILELINAGHVFNNGVGVFDLNLQVPRGIIFGLIGPSGSGKTTTVRLLNGVYKPTNGTVSVMEEAPHKFSIKARENIGYMPQHFVLYPMLTVAENLNFVSSLYGLGFFSRRKKVKNILSFVELYKERNRLASKLSGGMQRRLQLACALVHEPDLIFADEPTTGIDPILRGKFWEHFRFLRDQGRSLFVTTQYIGEAEQCDIIGIMHEGRLIYFDTPGKLRRQVFRGDIIRLSVTEATVREAVHLLNSQSTVSEARRSKNEPGIVFVSVSEAASEIPKLVALLSDSNIEVKQADQYIPPFDDVFIEFIKQTGGGND
jgi:ABC-2 type transport system ATP-binding protein